MYYTQEQIDRANQADLVSFLQSQGEQLIRAGQEYRWKRHDSLTVWETNGIATARARAAHPLILSWSFTQRSTVKPLNC